MAKDYKEQEQRKTLPIDIEGLEPDVQERIRVAVQEAGYEVGKQGGARISVEPGEVGEIETTFEISTAGLDDAGLEKLRAKAYANDKHTRILDSIVNSAVGAYGAAASTPFVQWIWCEWLQFSSVPRLAEQEGQPPREVFKKRFIIKPRL